MKSVVLEGEAVHQAWTFAQLAGLTLGAATMFAWPEAEGVQIYCP